MSIPTRRVTRAALATTVMLAGSATPALALNPQPLPPRWTAPVALQNPSPFTGVFLNPQPLPPLVFTAR